MITPINRQFCDSVQKSKVAVYVFLEDSSQNKSMEGVSGIVFRLPLKIDIQVGKKKSGRLSIESVLSIDLKPNQAQSLMDYAQGKKLPIEDAIIALFYEIYNGRVMEIVKNDEHLSKGKEKVDVKVGLWQKMGVTYM
jgi:hypothetical protein